MAFLIFALKILTKKLYYSSQWSANLMSWWIFFAPRTQSGGEESTKTGAYGRTTIIHITSAKYWWFLGFTTIYCDHRSCALGQTDTALALYPDLSSCPVSTPKVCNDLLGTALYYTEQSINQLWYYLSTLRSGASPAPLIAPDSNSHSQCKHYWCKLRKTHRLSADIVCDRPTRPGQP